jgi:hypothetical protein
MTFIINGFDGKWHFVAGNGGELKEFINPMKD